MFSASSSVVPTGTVMRFSLVITLLMGMSKRVSKRRSRLVRMPTSLPFLVMGTPEILYLRMTSSASETLASGDMVTGSTIMPLSERFTLSTSLACCSMRQVAVDDADSALLRQRDRHVRFGHRVHGGADDGNIQPDIARELGLRVGQRRNDVGAGGQQQHVIESKRLRDRKMDHSVFLDVQGKHLF